MNEISCVIIDDETSGRTVLRELLQKYCRQVTILGEASNIAVAYDLITRLKPDLVFLDIQLQAEDGFELLEKFPEIHFGIIFVTSFDRYAISAIKFSALDYLMKPVEVHELKNAIEKFSLQRKKNTVPTGELVLNLLNNLEGDGPEKKLAIHHQDKVKLLSLDDIVCFVAESNYTYLFTSRNEKFMPARLLKDFEDFLDDHEMFMRINKSVIVNLNYISEYSKGEPCLLYLKNGHEFEVSRRKKAELIARLTR